MRELLNATPAYEQGGVRELQEHMGRVRAHFAQASDDDVRDLVRLSVQMNPEKYPGSFQEVYDVHLEMRERYRLARD